MYYQVIVIDVDGCELSNSEEDTLQDAKELARARIKEKEYLDAGAYTVQVRDSQGVCVWDAFA